MPSQIFLSYRREDTSASAGRFHDHLCARLASDQVFMDVDTLEPGVDFVKAIEKSVSSCDVLIAVIGKHWLTSSDEERRLDNPEDYVRIEIATALKRDLPFPLRLPLQRLRQRIPRKKRRRRKRLRIV